MIITDILPIDKKRSKVYIDEEYAFPLYLGEMRRYKIKVGEEITEEIIDYVEYAKAKGCELTGTEDMNIEMINVLKEG